jgi:hypothetical protein
MFSDLRLIVLAVSFQRNLKAYEILMPMTVPVNDSLKVCRKLHFTNRIPVLSWLL